MNTILLLLPHPPATPFPVICDSLISTTQRQVTEHPLLKHGCKSLQGGPLWWWIFTPTRCSAQTHPQKEPYHRCLGGLYQLKISGDFLSCGLTCDAFYSFAIQSVSSDISWELTGNEHSEVPTQAHWIRKHIFKKSSWICDCTLNSRSIDPDLAKIYYTAIILVR